MCLSLNSSLLTAWLVRKTSDSLTRCLESPLISSSISLYPSSTPINNSHNISLWIAVEVYQHVNRIIKSWPRILSRIYHNHLSRHPCRKLPQIQARDHSNTTFKASNTSQYSKPLSLESNRTTFKMSPTTATLEAASSSRISNSCIRRRLRAL